MQRGLLGVHFNFHSGTEIVQVDTIYTMNMWPRMKMKTYTTIMLCATVFFLFADQNLLSPNLSAIADDFGFTDEERDEKLGGYIAFGFFVVGGPIALLVGYFADVSNRPVLFGLVVAVGEFASFCAFWVKTYPQLFVCRVFTGISIGGATPVIFSMLGDLYPGESRIYVSTLVGVALAAGISGGQLLSGMIGPALGWRAPFLFVSIPSLICAGVVFLTVRDPIRGDQEQETLYLRAQRQLEVADEINPATETPTSERQTLKTSRLPVSPSSYRILDQKDSQHGSVETGEADIEKDSNSRVSEQEHDQISRDRSLSSVDLLSSAATALEVEYSERIDCSKVLTLFSTPSVALIFAQGFPGCLPWGMIYVFLNDYFSNDRGMTVQEATAALTIFGVGGLAGQVFGGWAGQKLYNIDKRWQCVFMGLTTLLSVLPMLYLLNTEEVGTAGFYFMSLFSGFMVSMNGPNVRAVLQNVCVPAIRGTAFAVFSLTDDIGKGLGPALVVVFIRMCGGNRRQAFNIVVLFWLFCGSLLLLLTQTVIVDEAAVQRAVREALQDSRFDPHSCGDIDADISDAPCAVLTTTHHMQHAHAPLPTYAALRSSSPHSAVYPPPFYHATAATDAVTSETTQLGSPVHNPLDARLLSSAHPLQPV